MNSSNHSQGSSGDEAEEIFCSVIEGAVEQDQESFIESACAGKPDLLNAVRALLTAHATCERFMGAMYSEFPERQELYQRLTNDSGLRSQMGTDHPALETLGMRIASYTLVKILGEGGCGVVYLASQEKPVRRQVALKIIKLGMDTLGVIARFEYERQALAMMDHPGIARVIDAGATESGRPYFVMDLVRGVKITQFCDDNRLTVPERLELFIQVCMAIQHAHQKGIIHRDIKPSNVIVSVDEGIRRPVVIDFGISTAFDGRIHGETVFTCHEHFLGTPDYMSPEQARRGNLDMDTRSDIYSLGVLLFELITGRPPFDRNHAKGAGWDTEAAAPRMSAFLLDWEAGERERIAALRSEEATRLVRRLKGELDWIVAKALETDRDRRYPTAIGLAMDLRRHLEGEPVLARPASRRYRFAKLVSRNKVTFILGSTTGILLVGGLAATTTLLMRERALRDEQFRLREVAERGRKNEAQLRNQAEWREGLARAAALIYRNEMAAADREVVDLVGKPPISEGSYVLRTLGEWHALKGDWSLARDRFELLLSANQLDNLDNASLDLLAAAVSILESGDVGRYEAFCNDAAASFRNSVDPMVADRVLKASLLKPASDKLKTSLIPFAALITEHSGPSIPADDNALLWRCQTLALWSLRMGRYNDAIAWSDRVIAGGEVPHSRASGSMAIRAMALSKLNRNPEAMEMLDRAYSLVPSRNEQPLAVRDPEGGFWFDRVISEILVNQADAFVGGGLPAPR